jgi:hypothetical protein
MVVMGCMEIGECAAGEKPALQETAGCREEHVERVMS